MRRTVLVIDDHPLVQEAVASALQSLGPDFRVVAVPNAEAALVAAGAERELDLVLLDLALPDMNGIDLIRRLRAQHATLPILVLSALEASDHMRQAMAAGALGFVPKSAATRILLDAVTRVLAGDLGVAGVPVMKGEPRADSSTEHPQLRSFAPEPPSAAGSMSADPELAVLTARQVQVLSRVCEGKTNKQIATELALSEKTVKAHVTAIFKVLRVVNRTQAVLASRRVATIVG